MLAFSLILFPFVPTSAGTTGNVNGTIRDASATPVPNVAVRVASPSGTFSTTTDPRGFYSVTGLPPDTYSVFLIRSGFENSRVDGIAIAPDQTQTVDARLQKTTITIGRVTAGSASSAYQPKQTTDTYTVSGSAITTQLNKANNISESQLIVSLPGATLDNSGYPVVRGGRENEEGFQFEGISYTDAYTNQFVNSLRLNGVQSFQVTPGAGDATAGNAGTGVVNVTSKRGTRPAFGSLDLESAIYPYNHQFGLEYGFATPNNRFSNYFSFQGTREDRIYGTGTGNLNDIGAFFANQNVQGNDFVNNLVYRFGKDGAQSLQLFYQNQIVRFGRHGGAADGVFYKTNDPFSLSQLRGYSGYTTNQVQSVIGLDPQQRGIFDLARASASFQPNEALKLQYSNSLNASTFLSIRAYKVNAVTEFNSPNTGAGSSGASDSISFQGGMRGGFGLDLTKQVNEKNLVSLGGQFEKIHPIFDTASNDGGFNALTTTFGKRNEIDDFLSPSDPTCPKRAAGGCGYLAQFFGGIAPRTPNYTRTTPVDEFTYAYYVRDQFSLSPRLRLDLGLRFDGAHFNFPGGPYDSSAVRPLIVQPRAAVAYQIGPDDAVRAGYGRAVEFAPLADVERVVNRAGYNAYNAIPSYDNRLGAFRPANPAATAAKVCQITGDQVCANYGDQLYWEYQNAFAGVPYQPIKPETFSNYDFTYTHRFPSGFAVKITPFYRRGYDAAALVAPIRTDATGAPVLNAATGVPLLLPSVATNLGINRTTGVEFQLSRERPYGFSGQITATYINEFSNVIPLSGSEDFFPSIPPASLALGYQYRVGFVSPLSAAFSAQYKTRSGFRINPVVTYNRGYPIGVGLNTATFINGVAVGVLNTNVTSPSGSANASQYVDPRNPGTIFAPNIVATRGTPEASSAGGVLSNARFNTNISFEYTTTSHNTIGVLVSNLFDQLVSLPQYNTRWQPVATGVGGPLTGQLLSAVQFPGYGLAAFPADQGGLLPYVLFRNYSATSFNPTRSFRIYYQLGF